MIISLLMGRKGSKGFPGKNTYLIEGLALAEYPMLAAAGCGLVDKNYISTDDEKLMALAKKHGLEVIKRPPELCTDAALGEDVYLHGFNKAKEFNKGREIELIVLLMCNAPAITSKSLSEGITVLKNNPEYDSAVTVSRYNMWSPLRARKIGADGLLRPFLDLNAIGDTSKMNCDRDSQGDVWFADMGVSIIRPRCLENVEQGQLPQRWMGKKIYPLRQWGGLDVDYQWQIPQVEYWIKKHKGAEGENGGS